MRRQRLPIKKIKCKLPRNNILNLIGKASDCLVGKGRRKDARKMQMKCLMAKDYHQAYEVIKNYIDIIH